MVSAEYIPDEPAQRHIVNTVNPHLRPVGAELREIGVDEGYPVFSLVSTQAAHNRQPKNLIFASLAKPDIRFASAVDNDIEIVGNADEVLVYDRPIGGDGIRWRDLQAWWQDTQQIADDDEAKRSLYQRLPAACPATHRHSGTCSTSTTRSTAARCPSCRRCCPRFGCTGTIKLCKTAAAMPY